MPKFGIKIMPKAVLLDTQGRAVESSLKLQKVQIDQCRIGKYIELSVPGELAQAKETALGVTKSMLHNPLIEQFEITLLEER